MFDVESQKRYEGAQRKARITAYQAAKLERAREQSARMSSPILDALSVLDETIHEAVSSSLTSLRKRGGFKGRGASKLAKLFPMWKRLSGGVLNDAELEAELKELDELMHSCQAAGDKDVRDAQVGDIMAQLAEIAAMTSEATRETRRQGASRAAALEL